MDKESCNAFKIMTMNGDKKHETTKDINLHVLRLTEKWSGTLYK